MAIPSAGGTIDPSSIYDGFFNRFTQFANANIIYGTNNYHFADIPQTFKDAYGGPTSGIPQNTPDWRGIVSGSTITPSNIHDYVIGLSVIYCRIRDVRVRRLVSASGGPAESSSWANGISNMSTDYAAPGFTNPSSINDIATGNIINASILLSFMSDCYNRYVSAGRNNILRADYTVCHNSCHSSCHSSRGRR